MIHAAFEDHHGPDAFCGSAGGELTTELEKVTCPECAEHILTLVAMLPAVNRRLAESGR